MLLPPDFTPIEFTADFIAGLLVGIGAASSAWGLALHIWRTRRRPGPSGQEQPQTREE